MKNDLDPRAIADLARSGLASTDMMVENVHPAFGPTPGYLIPYFDVSGVRSTKMYRVRLYESPPNKPKQKYTQPDGAELADPCPPYFAPPTTYDYSQRAPRKLIVEGEKKAVSAIKYLGIASVGIGGCTNWVGHDPNNGAKKHSPKNLNSSLRSWVQKPDTELVEVVFDADLLTNENVGRAASGLWWTLREFGINAQFVVLPEATKGLDDWIMAQPHGTARANFDRLRRIDGCDLPVTAVPEMLHCLGIGFDYDTGKLTVNERVLRRVLTRHPRYMERLWVDMVKHRNMCDDEPFTDALTLGWLVDLQEFMPTLKWNTCHQTMNKLAWERQINPITTWLGTLKWDCVPRLETFAPRYLKLDRTPYLDRVFANFMVGAVARMHKPGTKFDHMLVLQGPQNIGKTTLLRELFGTQYATIAPHTTAIGSRDWLDAGGSGWCLILDELAGLSRVEHTDLKSALSTEEDTYRRAYRRDPETFPRMFVAAATTNEDVYLTDPTGNRRYWGVACTEVDVAAMLADRDQLWAEATALYRAGFDFWFLPPDAAAEAKERQDAAHVPDPTAEQVEITLARAYAENEKHRPNTALWMGRLHYFVPALDLMRAVSGEAHSSARNTFLSKRVRTAMLRISDWAPAQVRINGAKRRGYALDCAWADLQPRTKFATTWEAEMGRGTLF